MRVAIYIRVSTPSQAAEGYSLSMQENTLRQYCESKGYEVVEVYEDAGLSAKDIMGRPELNRLIGDATKDFFDVVLVWKLSRFTRSLTDLCAACTLLESHGCYLESYSEAFDSRSPVGRMIRGVLGVVAQWEREVISENVAAALRERATQGKTTTFNVLGYDYIKGSNTLLVNPVESNVVNFLAATYINTRCLNQTASIAKELDLRGKRGAPLTAWSIETILTRIVYCGFSTWHDEIFLGSHDPIMPLYAFNEIQLALASEGRPLRSGRSRKYPLFTLANDGSKKLIV